MTAFVVDTILIFDGQTQENRLGSNIFNKVFIIYIDFFGWNWRKLWNVCSLESDPRKGLYVAMIKTPYQILCPVVQKWGEEQK